jgi:hypothetical protein
MARYQHQQYRELRLERLKLALELHVFLHAVVQQPLTLLDIQLQSCLFGLALALVGQHSSPLGFELGARLGNFGGKGIPVFAISVVAAVVAFNIVLVTGITSAT